jgi:hypothetical protein
MALTTSQTQKLYVVLGLRGEGTTRYRVRWNVFATFSIPKASISWDYSTAKTTIDARLAELSAGALTELATYIDRYAAIQFSTLEVVGGPYGVSISHSKERANLRDGIYRLVGFELEEVSSNVAQPMENVNGQSGGPAGGRIVR